MRKAQRIPNRSSDATDLSRAGFSLIELIIAVSVMVMLTGVISPALVRYIERGRERRDQQNINMVYSALESVLYDEIAYDALKSSLSSNGVYSAPIAVSTLFLQDDSFADAVRDYIPVAPMLVSRKARGDSDTGEIMIFLREEVDRNTGIRMVRTGVWAGSSEQMSGDDFWAGFLPAGMEAPVTADMRDS